MRTEFCRAAAKFHTGSLRGIFSRVHGAVKSDLKFCVDGRKSCRVFQKIYGDVAYERATSPFLSFYMGRGGVWSITRPKQVRLRPLPAVNTWSASLRLRLRENRYTVPMGSR